MTAIVLTWVMTGGGHVSLIAVSLEGHALKLDKFENVTLPPPHLHDFSPYISRHICTCDLKELFVVPPVFSYNIFICTGKVILYNVIKCVLGHHKNTFLLHKSHNQLSKWKPQLIKRLLFWSGGSLCLGDKHVDYYVEHFELENRPEIYFFSAVSTVFTCVEIL